MDIRHPINSLVHIYSCFHFLPGCYENHNAEARRNDGALHLFNTTPDSPAAQRMMDDALASGDLYRIGIAAHCYADTWAHQNFVGFKHAFNAVRLGHASCETDIRYGLDWLWHAIIRRFRMVLPSIGHANAVHDPDIPNMRWSDSRLQTGNAGIRNKGRFLLAAEAIFARFARHNGMDEAAVAERWADLERRLDRAIGEESSDARKCRKTRADRVRAYRAMAPDMPEYDAGRWLAAAVEPVARYKRVWEAAWRVLFRLWKDYRSNWMRIRTFTARPGFHESLWLRFQEAVKEHQAYVRNMLRERYEQIGSGMRGEP
jgi:hypothetical protein